MIEQYIRYEFPISNNQAEYEALLARLALAQEIRARALEICTDSQVLPRERRLAAGSQRS
ncbi:hypothetical protein PIB30_061917 [Stylosanthes scabra]|uniref:Uncharacterized protein n=1 Tax=Stylosanthes scabra TaxID=79078 RepID=A0ABU6ZJP9_9FABA|nr:hypothetical protein [Stylosanthes scabra]